MRGLQCPKSLYLNKYYRELRDELDVSQEAIFRTGKMVGELACGLFPGGVNASPPDPFHYQDSVQLTRELIAEGTEVIYEAAFCPDLGYHPSTGTSASSRGTYFRKQMLRPPSWSYCLSGQAPS